MGGGFSFSAFGCSAEFSLYAANPTDAALIKAFIESVGIKKAKSVVDQSEEIAKILEDGGHEFPSEDVDIDGFIKDITPE